MEHYVKLLGIGNGNFYGKVCKMIEKMNLKT